jgi:cysteine-rich repeat protein
VPINTGLGPGACTNCGNLIVDYFYGEECDDGEYKNGDGCDANCRLEQPPTCGNDHLDIYQGEECDDGNLENGDGCSSTCQLETVGVKCGDQKVEGLEVCDNGDAGNKDMCNLNTNPVCSCSPPCDCNSTCNLTATTSLYAGQPGVQGLTGGDRLATALIGGYGVMTASNRHIYFSDGHYNIIRRVDVDTGIVETIAGDRINGNAGYLDDPTGLKARFTGIEALTTDGRTLWVADSGNHVIRAVDLADPDFPVTTVAGVQYPGGTSQYQDHTDPLQAYFDGLRGLTYYRDVIYLVDDNASTLRSFNPKTGEVKTLAGQVNNPGDVDEIGTRAQFMSPRYMTSDNSGMLYVADTEGAKIRTYNTMTGKVGTFAGNGIQGYVDGQAAAVMIHRPHGPPGPPDHPDGDHPGGHPQSRHLQRQRQLPGGRRQPGRILLSLQPDLSFPHPFALCHGLRQPGNPPDQVVSHCMCEPRPSRSRPRRSTHRASSRLSTHPGSTSSRPPATWSTVPPVRPFHRCPLKTSGRSCANRSTCRT